VWTGNPPGDEKELQTKRRKNEGSQAVKRRGKILAQSAEVGCAPFGREVICTLRGGKNGEMSCGIFETAMRRRRVL